jgi:chaperonin GroES
LLYRIRRPKSRSRGDAVGNGRVLKAGNVVPLDVKSGAQFLFGKHAGTEITLDDEELLVMHEADIMAVLEE